MKTNAPDAMLRHAAWYLMREPPFWYDRVRNEHGDMVPGPYWQAVTILCQLASEIRAGLRTI